MKPPRFLSHALHRLGMLRGAAEARAERSAAMDAPATAAAGAADEQAGRAPRRGFPVAPTSGWPRWSADAATVHVDTPTVETEGAPADAGPVPDPSSAAEGEDPAAREGLLRAFSGASAVPPSGWPLGPYRILSLLGEGGMGNVYRAVHDGGDAEVAIKVLHRVDRREGFAREARAVARLDHPGVIRLYDLGDAPPEATEASGGAIPRGSPFLVMEYATGGSLEAWPPTHWPELHRTVDRVLETLGAVHARGLVHRDLKPANILRTRGGWGRGSLKLADFGLAAGADEPAEIAGTPHYMAPEQIDPRRGEVGPWSDIYALGAIAWRWLTGRPAFDGPSTEAILIAHLRRQPPAFVPREGMDAPPEAEALLRKMLARAPRDRFEFAADAREAWRRLLPGAAPRDFPTARRPAVARAEAPPLLGAGLRLFALREAPLTGRGTEQEVLWDALAGVFMARRARAVVLEGAPGVGKSRLARWLLERAHEEGVARGIAVRHAPGSGHLDTGLRPALARALGVHRLEGHARVDRLRERLEDGQPAPADHVARVLALLDPEEGAAGTAGLPPVVLEGPEAQDRVVEEVLSRLSRDRPVVLWLDDLHWGPGSARFLAWLLDVQESRPLPVLVVATVRAGEEGSELRGLGHRPEVARVPLPPLAPADAMDLVRRTLEVEPELARAVADRSEGNPLFAVRLLGAWVSEAALESGDGGLRLRHGYREEGVPAGIREVWERRVRLALQGLPQGARDVLRHAAALGTIVRRDELRAALASPSGPGADLLVPAWEAALETGLLRDAGPGIAQFDHGLLRDCLLGELGDAAAAVHRACAEGLNGLLDRRSSGVSGRIGRHWLAAGVYEPAAECLIEEARARFFSFAIQEAEAALASAEEAMTLGQIQDRRRRAGLLLVRARVQRQAGHFREAMATADEAWDLAADTDPALAGRAAHLAGVAAEGLRDLDRSHELGLLGLDRAKLAGDPVLESDCLRLLGVVAAQRGDLRTGLTLLRQAADVLARAGSRRDLLFCLNTLVFWAAAAGDLEGARQGVDLARTVAHGVEDPGVRALELRMEAVLARVSGDSDAALHLAAEAREAFSRSGARIQELYCLDEMGEAARGVGDLAAAERWYREAMAGWAALGDTRGAAIARINLALVGLAREQLPEARALAEEARADFEREGNLSYVAASLIVLAEISAAEGRLADAEALLDEAVDQLDESGFVHEDLAEMFGDLGQRAAASGRGRLASKARALAARHWERLGRADMAAPIAGVGEPGGDRETD